MPREETRPLHGGGGQHPFKGLEAASALKYSARAIPVYGCGMWYMIDEAARRDRYNEQNRDDSSRDNISKSMLTLMGTGTTDANGLIEKLKDARCKWMVALHRYLHQRNPSSVFKQHQSHWLRPGSLGKRGEDRSNAVSANGTPMMLRFAADFCRYCHSIVDGDLEYTAEGAFVAEKRSHCATCEMGQQQPALPRGYATALRHIGNQPRRASAPFPATVSPPMSSGDRTTVRRPNFRGHQRASAPVAESKEGLARTNRVAIGTTRREGVTRFARRKSAITFPGEPLNAGPSARKGGDPWGVKAGKLPGGAFAPEPSMYLPDGGWSRERIRAARRERETKMPTARATSLGEQEGNDEEVTGQCKKPVTRHRDLLAGCSSLARDSGGLGLGEGVFSDWAKAIRARDKQIFQLKQQLVTLGEQPIEEVVSPQEAKRCLREAVDALVGGDSSTETEQALQKWDRYITNHPEHIQQKEEEEKEWEEDNTTSNAEALQLMKTFVLPDNLYAGIDKRRVRGLPAAVAKRVFERKVLWLMRALEGMISRTHMVELKSKLLANDLDVVESRAMHACLPEKFKNNADRATVAWRQRFRGRLREILTRETAGKLRPAEQRHPIYKNLSVGPFNPNTAVVELETRSSAFNTVVKPAVAPMEAWKISAVSAGLSKKLKQRSAPPASATGLTKDLDKAGRTSSRSASNSPASKYRRTSFVESRARLTQTPMKEVMSELESRLTKKAKDQLESEMPLDERDRPDPGPQNVPGNGHTTIFGHTRSVEEDECATVPAVPAAEKDMILYTMPSTSRVAPGERVGDSSTIVAPEERGLQCGARLPWNIEGVKSELAVKTEARKERSLVGVQQASRSLSVCGSIPELRTQEYRDYSLVTRKIPLTAADDDLPNVGSISPTHMGGTYARQGRRPSLRLPFEKPAQASSTTKSQQDVGKTVQANACKQLCVTEIVAKNKLIREEQFADGQETPPTTTEIQGRNGMSHGSEAGPGGTGETV